MKIQRQTTYQQVRTLVGGLLLLLCTSRTYAAGPGALSCSVNPDEGPNIIYQNGFQLGWREQGSWIPPTHTESVVSPSGVSGDMALKVVYANNWNGVELHNDSIDTRYNRALTFRVRSEENMRNLRVAVHLISGTSQWLSLSDDHYIPSFPGIPPFVVGQWYTVVIPLADFGLQPQDVYVEGFMFQSSLAGTIYLDDVMVVENFKLPLPGGKNWLLTTEIGDEGCARQGDPKPSHIENNHFALDFAPKSQGVGDESNVPVYAVAGGVVLEANYITTDGRICNGYHVIIDHDYDGNEDTGIQSRYLHMAAGSLAVQKNDIVSRGTRLGVVGGTGSEQTYVQNSIVKNCGTWGSHLHIGFRSGSVKQGYAYVTELDHLVMEGIRLNQYRATCTSPGVPNRYFPSSNTQ